jgi:hypothetical protein
MRAKHGADRLYFAAKHSCYAIQLTTFLNNESIILQALRRPAMKVNEINVQYIIPGHEAEVNGPEQMDQMEGLEYAPYDQMQPTELPAQGGWKEILGLHQKDVAPTDIDPPIAPPSLGGRTRIEVEKAQRHYLQGMQNESKGTSASLNVRRMISLLASYQHSADEIRARSLKGRYR